MKVTVQKAKEKGNSALAITGTDGMYSEPQIIIVTKAQAQSLSMTLSRMAESMEGKGNVRLLTKEDAS